MLKKLLLYRFNPGDFQFPSEETLEMLVSNSPFGKCPPTSVESCGFVPVAPYGLYSYCVKGQNLDVSVLEFKKETKIIPKQTIKYRSNIVVEGMKNRGIKVSKEDKENAQISVTKELAKTAFSRHTNAYILIFRNLGVVGISASESLSDEITSELRRILPDHRLPLVQFPSVGMSSFLTSCLDGANDDFDFGTRAQLIDIVDKSEITLKGKSNEEVSDKAKDHTLTKMEIQGCGLSFMLSNQTPLVLSQIKSTSSDMLKIKKAMDEQEKKQTFDTNCHIELGAVNQVLTRLLAVVRENVENTE